MRIYFIFGAMLVASSALAQSSMGNSSLHGQVVSFSTGAPIPNATVSLVINMGRTVSTRPSLPEIETDEQGRFAFRNLGPGIYTLTARRQGFVRAEYRSIGSHTVILGENQTLAGAVLKLIPEGALAVKAMDSDGRPLKRALIRLLRNGPPAVEGASMLTTTGRTNEAGECRLANLAPGDYVLEANPPDGRPSMSGRPVQNGPQWAESVTYYPDATELGGAAAIRIEAGETRSIEIRLKKTPTVSVRGRIIDSGLKTSTTFLRLVPLDAPDRSLNAGGPQIGADGSFAITGVTPGAYLLTAVRSRFEESTGAKSGTITIRPGSVTALAAAARSIQVADKNLDGISLDMKPLFDLRGSVAVEQNAQCRFTSGIDTVTNVRLRPQAPGATYTEPVRIGAGPFTIPNVARMPYRVTVSYNGDCYVKAIRYGGQEAQDGVVDFAGDGPLEIIFAKGERLEGVAVERNGRAVSGGTVTLVPKDGPASAIQSAFVGANGSFTLRGIRKGAYDLFAWDETFDSVPRHELLLRLLKVFKGRGMPVTLDDAADSPEPRIEIVSAADIARFSGPLAVPPPVKARGVIAGQVLDASGFPLKGVTLSLQGWREATPEASAKTNDSGRFEFWDLEPGFYKLSAQHPGFASAAHGSGESPYGSIILGEGQQVRGIELRLSPRP